jgi:hypothetical protein
MAAIFQIRRGTSNETLTDGELYLHKGIGSIQFGSGSSNVITLLPLNAPVNGNINLIGNISASGDVRIGGNIYLGDNLANDSVNVNSPFSGSLIPSGSNIFDLGSNTYKYKNVYATSISGAIAATNGVVSGSSQITYVNISSIPAGIVSGSSQVLGGTGIVSGSSQVTPLLPTGVVSGSSQIIYASISSIPSGIVSGSVQVTPLLPTGVISGSSQIDATLTTNFATGVKTQLNTNTVVSGSSQITYANISSIPGGIVSGSSQITYINISSIPGGIVSGSSQTIANLPTGTVSGSSQITYANISSIPGGIVSGSSQTIANLPTGTVSGSSQLTSSYDTRYSLSGSILTSFSTSIDYRLDEVEYTASLFGGGLVAQLDKINQATASLQLFTSSANSRLNSIEAATSSYETTGRGIVSGSSQVTLLLPTGVVSGSSQVNFTQLSGISNGIVSGSTQTIANLPTGTVSGSIQVLGGSTIHSGSSGDYQFNSIGVGTAATTVAGEIRAMNDITAFYSSDIRLKENIHPIQNALEKVESISGNTYDWKVGYEEFHSHKGNDIGVIAQEIEQILPQIVTNRDNGYKAVQYEKIVPLLIEAIKELSAKVKELESK